MKNRDALIYILAAAALIDTFRTNYIKRKSIKRSEKIATDALNGVNKEWEEMMRSLTLNVEVPENANES